MERWTADYLKAGLAHTASGEFIDRRTKTGSRDKGDIGGVRTIDGRPVVIEVKNTAHPAIGPWLREAEEERANDGAAAGLVVYKRIGYGEKQMGEQIVTMTLDNLIVLLGGQRPNLGQETNTP